MQNNLVGVQTPLGLQIDGYTSHFVGRMIGNSALNQKYNRPGVSMEALLDCFKSGRVGNEQVIKLGERSILLKSDKCNIAFNPDKRILIQCNSK